MTQGAIPVPKRDLRQSDDRRRGLAALRGRGVDALRWFRALPLHLRFALVGGLVSLIGMSVIGAFVSSRIENGVVRNSAISAAIYMESFIAPLSQDLAEDQTLSPASIARLNAVLTQPPVADEILSVKIWKSGGVIAYANDKDLIGQRFEPTDDLTRAWQGDLLAGFDELDDDESEGERALGVPLLEVYNPIHSIGTGEIIAVAEFYQNATELERDLARARLTSWAVIACVSLATFFALFGIVRAGHRTIEAQRSELQTRMCQLSDVSQTNVELRQRIQHSAEQFATHNEQHLRRVGAELHDGPAQALAFAQMRIGAWKDRSDGPAEATQILGALGEALDDIRSLARGMVLPALEGGSVAETIQRAANAHSARTMTTVDLDGNDDDAADRRPELAHLICIYRFVQEGLANAWRHGGATDQRVAWTIEGDALTVTVSDAGPGFDPDANAASDRIGLHGLRERLQSVGGRFDVDSAPGRGTRITMHLELGHGAA
ncbi:sensor histidine kinase [Paracoccus sp. TK19116]|uniref:Sensor histidine kinase n=1 Tax=Paracoccus albicereus TaxID=2922394 RepID=A0ABT1MV99_9RHOB|nr:sensor histidine kinase [Paracoccus albicereus]MCQ0972131.1 sensor histidine kinase [Paracoccus albicereus]